VDLHGGGILRLRPDGTELEVYCTGVRNILDVALDAEDEIFTYDNTDEHQWMSRLTHMVDGGAYGYPYDFIPRRPYTLWMMADYGGGAATGTTCYTEDALPPEYHGNLFLADFGKRQVLRVTIARDGGTFRSVTRNDLFTDVPESFRPVGIAWSPDGLSLYICDWQHRDTKEAVAVGRLLKLTYTGSTHPASKPSWFVDSALGRAADATVDDLIRGLSHPARSIRDVAQRRLAVRGAEAVAVLRALLGDSRASPQARRHAVWALDAIDGGVAGRKAIFSAVRDPDAGLRRQAIRQLGTRRVCAATEILLVGLKDADASVRFQAATALGRIGDPTAVPGLIEALDEPDLFARYAVFTALNRIGRTGPSAWPVIVGGLVQSKAIVREGVRLALRETYDDRLVTELAAIARNLTQSQEARTAALELLAGLARRQLGWKGEWWAYHPALGTPPPKSESWTGTTTVLAALRDCLGDASPEIRRTSVEGLRQAQDGDSSARLRTLFRAETDPTVRRAVLSALGALHDREARTLVAEILKDPGANHPLLPEAIAAAEGVGGDDVATALEHLLIAGRLGPSLLRSTIKTLGRLRWPGAAARLVPHAHSADPELRRAALEALVRIDGPPGRTALLPLVEDPVSAVRQDALSALGDLGDRATIPTLLQAYREPGLRSGALSALVRIPDLRALEAYLEGLGGKDAALREGCRRAISTLKDKALPAIESKLDRLAPDVLVQLRQVFEGHEAGRWARLFARASQAMTPEDYLAFVSKHPGAGDPVRGRKLFHDRQGAGCIKCHRVGGEGGEVGPDLSTVGAQFDRGQIAESVLYPSRSIREGYQAVIVATAEGRVLTGLVRSESGEALVLRDAEDKDHEIRKEDMAERRSSSASLMPEGLQLGLSPQEFADLMSYLDSLRPPPQGPQPR
jgi:putative heme-binding domain-containing protein